jgi:hypothetical protein
MVDERKIRLLRAAVLSDLKEFIPDDLCQDRTGEGSARNVCTLAIRLTGQCAEVRGQFTPRQLSAINLLGKIGLYCIQPYSQRDTAADIADGLTPEIIEKNCRDNLRDAINEYLSFLGTDEARPYLSLSDIFAAVEQSAPVAKVATQRRQRQDALAVELDEILVSMKTRTPAKVMAELREQIGKPNTCITANVGDGIQWERDNGNVETLSINALGERIRNWKKKNQG